MFVETFSFVCSFCIYRTTHLLDHCIFRFVWGFGIVEIHRAQGLGMSQACVSVKAGGLRWTKESYLLKDGGRIEQMQNTEYKGNWKLQQLET